MQDKPKRDEPNPYDWQGESKPFVGREALLEQAVATCLEGDGVFLLLGTRGMGKSVFLAHLEAELRKSPELEIVSFSGPPFPAGPTRVADDILLALLDRLLECAKRRGRTGAEFESHLRELTKKRQLRELFDVYLSGLSDEAERIVLIYDELDRYAESTAGRDYFNALEDARKKMDKRLVVVAAGGLGMLSLKTILGSSIFTRAVRKVLEPFHDDELEELAEPFRKRGVDLTATDLLATLRLLSGGNLALATYGLQSLWGVEEPSVPYLSAAFERFRDDHHDFIGSIRGAIFDFDDSQVPFHVWQRLRETGGILPKAELAAIRQRGNVKGAIENKDILDILRAGGLIQMVDSAWKAEPILAQIIPSILSFDVHDVPRSLSTLQEQLHADIVDAMADIHRRTPAYYVQGSKKANEKKKLVPEASFQATLAAYLSARGWKVELEAMSGAGFADIKARHPRFGEAQAIVEVKLWPRHTGTIHDQITSYFTAGVTALATVVIADRKDAAWKDDYEKDCLTDKTDDKSTWKPLELPLEGYFEARWRARVVEHFLLRLPSRS
jgi:AAA ATPase domain